MRKRATAWMRSAVVRRLAAYVQHLRDDRGVAALEFALLMPIMLGLYLSTIVTTKAYMASRKVSLVARSLADIASRQAVGATTNCTPTDATNPCVGNADITSFFAAAATIMAPYPTTTLKMTLSRIDILQDSANKLWAFTKWSVKSTGSGTTRPCNGTNALFTPPGTPALTSNNSWYPLLTANVSPTTTGFEKNLAPAYTNAGAPTGFLIVADVTYQYTPGFSFNIFNWTNVTTINTGWTQGFWSRTGLPIDGHLLTTNATVCTANDPNVG